MKAEAPAIFQDVEVLHFEDGYPTVRSQWRKV